MKFLESRAIETWHFDTRGLNDVDIEALTRDLAAIGIWLGPVNLGVNVLEISFEDSDTTEAELFEVFARHGIQAKLREKTRETERVVAKRLLSQSAIQIFFAALFLYVFRIILEFLFHGVKNMFPGLSEGTANALFWSIQALAVMINFYFRSDPLYVLQWILAFALSLLGGPKSI